MKLSAMSDEKFEEIIEQVKLGVPLRKLSGEGKRNKTHKPGKYGGKSGARKEYVGKTAVENAEKFIKAKTNYNLAMEILGGSNDEEEIL